MKAEIVPESPREHIPSSLYRHPAWIAWKESQGWRQAGALEGRPLLLRRLDARASMAYAIAPPLDGGGQDLDRGGLLEDLSRRAQAMLPSDCAFIRWDLMGAPWKDGRGEPLDARLLELRMNASTRHRRLRKSRSEHMLPDTMLVELRGGWRGVAARMDHRARYSAQLAERRGTAVNRVGEAGLGDFHALLCKTTALRGIRLHGVEQYRALFRAAAEHGLRLELYLATVSGAPAAAAIFARHAREAWYLFAASDPEFRPFAAPSAILHQALRDCAEAGDEVVDLCGVAPEGRPEHPLAGLSLFKSGFGGIRRSRAGAWDFVLDAEAHHAYSQAESLSAI